MHRTQAPLFLSPQILRLRAPNASALTGTGTNSYLIKGPQGAVLIDPGPQDEAHIAQILAALKGDFGGEPLVAILITHAHQDHSGAADALARRTGARVLCDDRGPAAMRLALQGGASAPPVSDMGLRCGHKLAVAGMMFSLIHTPGHIEGHFCFGLGSDLFTGDHVMGWSTSLIAPPEGDMQAYHTSLLKLQGLGFTRYLPGHGEVIANPEGRLAELIAHRTAREAQVQAALAVGPADAKWIAERIYTDAPPPLMGAAALSVLAHLIALHQKGHARCNAPPSTLPNIKTVFAAS